MNVERERQFMRDMERIGCEAEIKELKRQRDVLRFELTEAVDLLRLVMDALQPLMVRYDALRQHRDANWK